MIDREIYLESLAREIVRRVQVMRNKANLKVDDYIVMAYETTDKELADAIDKHADYIMTEVRAKEVKEGIKPEMFSKEWVIEGKKIKLAIKKVFTS